MASTSSETPSLPGSNYVVFLSFRGEDTRHSFTDHLYKAFILRGIEAFRDSEKLQLGQEIASELIQAIEKSQYAIVVFSEKYADSKWCLDELAKIVECKINKRLEVVPVFYHVDPSDVRKQTGPFEKAFDEHQKNDKIDREKIQKWKDAMREVGSLSGEHLRPQPHQRSEAECIQDIVEEVLNKLRNTAHTTELIGMESRVEKLKSYLTIESNDVRIIGIWGTGGMGKTALARVVYSMVSNHFEACCFIANVREESEKCGLCKLQKKLLKKLLMLKNLNLNLQDVDDGVQMIKNRLHNKKILLVLDDVNELDQLKKLAGDHCWFGSGSRIMITTRDRHLLVYHEGTEIYEAEVLNHDEALKLFSLRAFKMDHPTEDYGKLSQAFVDYCKGLPLALEILGSFLFKRSIDDWESELNRLIEFCDRGILNVLQISFYGLRQTEKEIFLNIACFFNHKNGDDVIKILDYLRLHARIGLSVLIDKSLIKLHENQLWMHDLLQEMGRDIVCQECKDPEERSRLWSFDDINNVLTENTGTKKIQCIGLEMHEPKNVEWNPEAFSKMQNLKLLKICGVQLMHGLKHLPRSLRVLEWREYPSKSLTSSFLSKCFENLKFIALKLTEGPDINNVPNLKSLVLQNCINLRRIHPSIGIHKKLTILDLSGCKNLTSLPSKFEMECVKELNLAWCSKITKLPEFSRNMKCVRRIFLTGAAAITTLPTSIENLAALRYLYLIDTAITTLPTSIGHLAALSILKLGGSAITTLPTSIEHLTNLGELELTNCKNLVHLPDTVFNLKLVRVVNLEGCSKLDRLPENLGNAESLRCLALGETAIRKVPSSIGLLKHLVELTINGCKGLSSNKSWYELLPFCSMPTSPHPIDLLFSSLSLSPASSLFWLDLSYCNLKAIPNDIGSLFNLYELDLSGNDFVCLPESIIRLSELTWLKLNNCTSLRSLPKLPLKVNLVEAEGCISLEMLTDPLKPSDSLEPRSLGLQNCFKLADNQSCIDWFISGIKKYLKLTPSLPLSVIKTNPYNPYAIVIPGSEIPEWFSHQSMGNEVKIKQPSHLCKKVGIAFCVVFCTNNFDSYPRLAYSLIANGKRIEIDDYHSINKVSSDHVSLVYVVPQYLDEESNKLLWEGDVNGFSHIRIKIESSRVKVKKWGIRMIYKKDIEDLDRTMVQYSNSSIAPYDGMDVLHHNFDHSSVVVECHKVKRSHDDYNGAGPSGEGSSKRIKRHTETNVNSDSEESSEFKDCDEELSDCEESNERNPYG
ncbi:disease resistance protein RUN1-like [Quercus robur]|uniref:disease resistance protein RUN1-like n=1 Tax=Quercus robur TaxID=38942 RepID=UPI002163FCEB|nr:disease resistance protein RUN1-like [Quercus robur]